MSIEKNMIQRHQLQLSEYFKDSKDAIIVAKSEEKDSTSEQGDGVLRATREEKRKVLLYNKIVNDLLMLDPSKESPR
jgi:hypothetical protein